MEFKVLIPIMESRLAYIMHLLKKSWLKEAKTKQGYLEKRYHYLNGYGY
jgi:hypothetical protein